MTQLMARNITLYRWSRFLRSLLFWQAVWFLYFQDVLSAAQAILLYAVFDVAVTLLEVPSGYMSDRLGRRPTLILSAIAAFLGASCLWLGDSFAMFAAGQILIGAGGAFASGTDEAMLFESLVATDRADEIEAQEVIAWRFSYSALAVSAVTGGAMAMIDPRLPFLAGAVATLALLAVTWAMTEPPHDAASGFADPASTVHGSTAPEQLRLRHLGDSFRNPVLVWIFALSVLMYGFSHVPFVFGQPFILEALGALDLAPSAPLVSGVVTAVMMGLSIAVSVVAMRLRRVLGLPLILLGAFALQIAICGVMALTDSMIVLAFLMLRMVPDALSRPFILGRIQPLLADDSRATWLSLKSFAGRLGFAAMLTIGAISTTDVGTMPYADIQMILSRAVIIGALGFAALALASRRIAVEPAKVADS